MPAFFFQQRNTNNVAQSPLQHAYSVLHIHTYICMHNGKRSKDMFCLLSPIFACLQTQPALFVNVRECRLSHAQSLICCCTPYGLHALETDLRASRAAIVMVLRTPYYSSYLLAVPSLSPLPAERSEVCKLEDFASTVLHSSCEVGVGNSQGTIP